MIYPTGVAGASAAVVLSALSLAVNADAQGTSILMKNDGSSIQGVIQGRIVVGQSGPADNTAQGFGAFFLMPRGDQIARIDATGVRFQEGASVRFVSTGQNKKIDEIDLLRTALEFEDGNFDALFAYSTRHSGAALKCDVRVFSEPTGLPVMGELRREKEGVTKGGKVVIPRGDLVSTPASPPGPRREGSSPLPTATSTPSRTEAFLRPQVREWTYELQIHGLGGVNFDPYFVNSVLLESNISHGSRRNSGEDKASRLTLRAPGTAASGEQPLELDEAAKKAFFGPSITKASFVVVSSADPLAENHPWNFKGREKDGSSKQLLPFPLPVLALEIRGTMDMKGDEPWILSECWPSCPETARQRLIIWDGAARC